MTTTDYSISKAQEIALLFGAQTPEQYLYEFVEGILIMADATVPSGRGGQMVGEEVYQLSLKISGRQKGLLREAIYLSRARAALLDEIERLREDNGQLKDDKDQMEIRNVALMQRVAELEASTRFGRDKFPTIWPSIDGDYPPEVAK